MERMAEFSSHLPRSRFRSERCMLEEKSMDAAIQERRGRTALASLAAVGSVILASSCCLPLLPFVFAAGLAGSSTLFRAARPYLLGASLLLIAYGFYEAWRAKKCNHRPNPIGSILLWTSALFVAASIFFPQVLANAAADLLTP